MKRLIVDNMKTTWEIVRSFINSKTLGDIVTRKELLQIVDEEHSKHDFNYSSNTVDCYRNLLEKSFYLMKTDELGKFQFIKKIPEFLTVKQLNAEYAKHFLMHQGAKVRVKDAKFFDNLTYEDMSELATVVDNMRKSFGKETEITMDLRSGLYMIGIDGYVWAYYMLELI